MIYGTGVDIVQVDRIKKIIERWGDKFLKRLFTAEEISYCKSKKEPAHYFAVRFAAKEAAGKMFGTGLGKIKWTDIEVKKDEYGCPSLRFYDQAEKFARKKGIERVHLSLSHEKEYSLAQVIGEGGKI